MHSAIHRDTHTQTQHSCFVVEDVNFELPILATVPATCSHTSHTTVGSNPSGTIIPKQLFVL